jgi:hypothetical protein
VGNQEYLDKLAGASKAEQDSPHAGLDGPWYLASLEDAKDIEVLTGSLVVDTPEMILSSSK